MCKTLVLYHNGPLTYMYVYVCIQMRCLIPGGRERGREGEKRAWRKREGGGCEMKKEEREVKQKEGK